MGKPANCFRALLCLRKPPPPSPPPPAAAAALAATSAATPPKSKWTFARSPDCCDECSGGGGVEDPNKHAIAVAAATAAVAEAAVAAAQAAAAVVKLTSGGRPAAVLPPTNASTGGGAVTATAAAVRIQAAFRAYLARRALRALKALVKLQALVRGHIVRKHTADTLRSIQALLRAQARARAGRAQNSESPMSSSKSSQFHCPDPVTPEKFEQAIRAKSIKHDQSSPVLKRSGSKEKIHLSSNRSDHQKAEQLQESRGTPIRTGTSDDDRSYKILEIDTGKPQFNPKRRNHYQYSHHAFSSDQHSHSFTTSKDSTTHLTARSHSSYEVQSLTPLEVSNEVEESSFCSANSSPQFFSASSKAGSSRRGPFTPAKSDCSRSFLSGYSDCPNYMACTESSRAKLRSHSAPKQRPPYERSSSTKRSSINGFGDSKSNAHRSSLHANFTNKAYPGSGRLDRLGMPVGYVYDHAFFANR